MPYDIRILCDYSNLCGECPLWDDRLKRLLWVDSDSTEIYEYDCEEKKSRIISADIKASSIVLNQDGIILLGEGVWLWDGKGEKKKVIDTCGGESLNFNDSIAGPDGCIYAGTYYWDVYGMRKYGKLYRIRPDFSMDILDEGIALSNGMAFSPDNKRFYYVDSAERSIYVYDFDRNTGAITDRRVFAKGNENGIPDGITVDGDGCVWCAMWYEGAIYRYSPDGKLQAKIDFPVKQVSSVTFGGEGMNILYATSARNLFRSDLMPNYFNENAELGGAVYFIKTNICGKIENRVDFRAP